MRPHVAVFDLGKVLLDFDYSIAGRKIAAQSGISAADAQHALDHSPLLFRYETGRMTTEEFLQAAMASTGFTGSADSFADAFSKIFTAIPALVDTQAALRARGVPTFIFSNTNPLAIRHVREGFPFFHQFDGYVLSYEHGSMKPDAALYEVVERMTGKRGAEILYIDDRRENVAAGSARGWQVVLQDNPDKSRAAIETAFGFKVALVAR